MDLRDAARQLVEEHFGLPVVQVEDLTSVNYHVKAPTGVTVAVIPVRFFGGTATQLAISSGFGGFDCPLRTGINGLKGNHQPHRMG